MANADTRVITSHVPVSLANQIDALAVRMKRSRGWIVKQALAEFVALADRRHLLTLEGLASVDARRRLATGEVSAGRDTVLAILRAHANGRRSQ